MARCYKGGKEHRFEARYDERPHPGCPEISAGWLGVSVEGARSLVYYRVYVRDVCVWCGETRERPAKEGA